MLNCRHTGSLFHIIGVYPIFAIFLEAVAVFTAVDKSAFSDWALRHYGIRCIDEFSPISEGIENTNYRFVADGHPYVFTIFEVWEESAVDYYAALMRHFADMRLPVPAAFSAVDGSAVGEWGGKPCVVVPFVDGEAALKPTTAHCQKMGKLVAELHIAASRFSHRLPNPRNHAWRRLAAERVSGYLTEGQRAMLSEVLERDAAFAALPLPTGACHCDLFRNNVLWKNDAVAAVIDFYFGGEDALVFDLAVCLCDWAFIEGDFSAPHFHALATGYLSRRCLTDLEKEVFADALCVAALRFWLSRLTDVHYPRWAEELTPHDPGHFERILRRACTMRGGVEQWLTGTA